jgi:hypothetical protein
MSSAKFLSEYHSSLIVNASPEPRSSREGRIDDAHTRLLLASMTDELSAQHCDKRVWVRPLLETVPLRMKRVARRMHTNESPSFTDCGEKGLLPQRAHRRHPVSAGLREVPRRVEGESIVLSQIAVETRPSFVATISKPCFLPMVESVSSEREGAAPVRFTGSCSNPEVVKKRIRLFVSSSAARP